MSRNASIEPARFSKTYATIAANVDLLADSFATSGVRKAARMIRAQGAGTIVVTYAHPTTAGVTITDTFNILAGERTPMAEFVGITAAGTTATGITVWW